MSASWTVPADVGVRRLRRAPGARRHRRREPDPVRRPRRRGVVGHAGQDVGRDVAGLQQVRRQQPLLVHRRRARRETPTRTRARSPCPTTGPFDGTITQDNGRSYLFYAEYQMIRFIERNGYDASYTSQADVDANAALLRNHKMIISSGHDEYWSGPRARQRRGGARRRREPRVLQRQRGVLEDALAAQQRRRHAPRSTGRSRPTRTRTSTRRPTRWRGPARGATRASRRPATAGAPRTR